MTGLRLDCLGASYAFSDGRYWSGFLLNGRILLDCPPQALAHLYRLGKAVPAQLDLILLSHEHADHIAGTDALLLNEHVRVAGAGLRDGRPLAIAGPPGIYARLRAMIGERERLPPRSDPRVVWFDGAAPDRFEWAGVTVERLAVEHDPTIESHGFRVHVDGGIVAYTGDTEMCDAVLQLAEGADVLIVECGGDRAYWHFEWPDIFALREQLPPSTEVLVTHYGHRDAPDVTAIDGLTLAQDFAVYEY